MGVATSAATFREHRTYIAGAVLGTTLVALESYTVLGIAPTIARMFDATQFYSLIFTPALVLQIAFTRVFAVATDRGGLLKSHLVGTLVLGIGLLVVILAPNIWVFAIGRAAQGIGMGAILNSIYASIPLLLPEHLQGKAFSILATAYVLPAAIGPPIAGLLTSWAGWRSVFVLLLIVTAALPILTTRSLARANAPNSADVKRTSHSWLPTTMLALLVGSMSIVAILPSVRLQLFVAVLSTVGVVACAGAAMPGLLTARTSRRAYLAARSATLACYIALESVLVLTLAVRHELPVMLVSFGVSAGALSWTAASWWQGRAEGRDGGAGRRGRVVGGALIVVVGAGIGMICGVLPTNPVLGMITSVVAILLAGLGIGIVEPAAGAGVMAGTQGHSGTAAYELQLADAVGPAAALALSGVALSITDGTIGSFAITLAFAAVGAIVCARLPRNEGKN